MARTLSFYFIVYDHFKPVLYCSFANCVRAHDALHTHLHFSEYTELCRETRYDLFHSQTDGTHTL